MQFLREEGLQQNNHVLYVCKSDRFGEQDVFGEDDRLRKNRDYLILGLHNQGLVLSASRSLDPLLEFFSFFDDRGTR